MTGNPSLEAALLYIGKTDKSFLKAIELAPKMRDRDQPEGFDVLAHIIVEQQVSLASAAAIWKRLSAAIEPFTPSRLLEFSEDGLRQLGLSRSKAKYCRELALDVSEGRLDLTSLRQMDNEKVVAHLTQVKGIGRWTAEIYMMTSLGRLDIWPAGDVALQTAMQHLKSLDQRPTLQDMDFYGEPLRPYRTVAARLLWCFYSEVVKKPALKK